MYIAINSNIRTGCTPFTQCSIFLNNDIIFFCNAARPEIQTLNCSVYPYNNQLADKATV